jgi:hypothetical protein
MTFTLTRLLYSIDEVEASLINNLLMKTDIDACYFWCAELYYSDREDERDIFCLLWKIFYDFYAALNPGLERYIQKKELNWRKEKNMKTLIYIIHNMFRCNPTADVFLLRQYVSVNARGEENLIIYKTRGKKYDWLRDFPASYHNMLIAIYKKQLSNAAVQLRRLVDTHIAKDVYNILVRYYSRHIVLQPQTIIDQRWKKHHWRDMFHSMLAMMIHLQSPIDRIIHPLVFHQPSADSIKMIESHNQKIEIRHHDCDKVYRILKDMRMYAIHDLIGVFQLDRFKIVNFKKENRLRWGEYAIKCPIWKKRIYDFNGLVKTQEVDLEKDKDKDFIDHYEMELDEQPDDIQMMSIKDIRKLTIDEWHNRIFTVQPILKLECSCIY